MILAVTDLESYCYDDSGPGLGTFVS